MQRVTRLAFAAVLVLSSTTIVQAQTTTTGRTERRIDRWPSGGANSEPQRLFVVIEASAGKKGTDISQIVKLGLEYLKKERKFDYEDVRVQPVSNTLYNGMKSLFRGEALDPAAEGDAAVGGGGPSIKLMPGGKSAWQIRTGGAYIRAKSITVFYEREEEGKVITIAPSITFQVAPVTEAEQAFRFHSPGMYIFTLDTETMPSRCEIELIADSDGTATPQIFKGQWPQENLYYLLLIDKFIGDRRILFETLKNNRVVGNGLKDVQTVESATISLATFIDSIDTGTSGWDDERHYHVRVKKPDDKFPKRAWLYFPLDAETAKTEMSRIKNICGLGAEDRQLLLESIRSSAILAPTDANSSVLNVKPSPSTSSTIPSASSPAASLPSSSSSSSSSSTTNSSQITNLFNANSQPAWFEVPAESKAGSSFARILEIGIDPTLPMPPEAAYGLAIYEFNDEVILSVGNNYVQMTEHPRWNDGVLKLSKILANTTSNSGTNTNTSPSPKAP